ncbi:hypothetical protein L211DRAFT_889947, partial [Terfezia boudieri ATCC MYA-4762]
PNPTKASTRPQQLADILSIYPILESFLSFSHRTNIVNLAQTCRTLHDILTTRVRALRNPLPRCTVNLKPCTLCNMQVCEDCRLETIELEKPSSVWSSRLYDYALVCGHTAASRERISKFLQLETSTTSQLETSTTSYVQVMHKIEHKLFCELCFCKRLPHIRKPVSEKRAEILGPTALCKELEWNTSLDVPKERALAVRYIMLEDLPEYYSTCACDRYNSGCERSPHMVKVEDVPANSELVGMVVLPASLPEGQNSWNNIIPLYVEVSIPAWGQEVQAGDHHVRSTWVPMRDFFGQRYF